jgi:hypothetical protein
VWGWLALLKKLYSVTFPGEAAADDATSYMVLANSAHSALHRARKLGCTGEATAIVPISREPAHGDAASAPPPATMGKGWIVKAGSADRKSPERQYLVAIEDGKSALAAIAAVADPSLRLEMGPQVGPDHLSRRNMKSGEIFALGVQRLKRRRPTHSSR